MAEPTEAVRMMADIKGPISRVIEAMINCPMSACWPNWRISTPVWSARIMPVKTPTREHTSSVFTPAMYMCSAISRSLRKASFK